MIGYHTLGKVPAKHHIALRRDAPDADGCPVYYEHCVTRGGFDGAFSILYRENNPGAESGHKVRNNLDVFEPVADYGAHFHRHHYPTGRVAGPGHLYESCRWLIGNADVRVGSSQPTAADTGLVQNGDGDLMLFIQEGNGRVESEMGTLHFRQWDYVWIPKGVIHRVVFDAASSADQEVDATAAPVAHVMVNESPASFQVPSNFMNRVGQLTMEAPYTHRDFRRPTELSAGKGPATVLHKRGDVWTERTLPHHPFDVVGWDGHVYPVALNALDYEPKVGMTHLPPPIHTTFLGGGGSFVLCTFAPRLTDFHPDAIPCPYPHSSVDCDEILWYVDGEFTSRKGVGAGSISHHPMGIPHAPQPGRYEASMGTTRTTELAVMIDTYKPLSPTQHAIDCEDTSYHGSWTA